MALLDKVPGDLNLYIGGLFTLRRKDALRQAGITHVLSVLRLPLDSALFQDFEHMVVEVDDVEDDNLLEHFSATNAFIQTALNGGGSVLVHCAMGKSRSATCVIAYLMQRYHITPTEALEQIRQSRPLCEPNEGFMSQLELYHQMNATDDVENNPVYQRWLYQREVDASRACGQAPDADKIRFEDEHTATEQAHKFDMRCRKCRRTLASSQFLVDHQAKVRTPALTADIEAAAQTNTDCAHFFLDPLSWMRPELEQGKLDGRLNCPKCSTNVGKYAWQGMQCSCGSWVNPAISLAKGRIDIAVHRTAASDFGIRMPPAPSPVSAKTNGQGNL